MRTRCYKRKVLTHTRLVILLFCSIAFLVLFNKCNFPYSPKQQPSPLFLQNTEPATTNISGLGSLYKINTNEQTCNPSISQNASFSASMLFLGFGTISVNVPDSLAPYNATATEEHDRLLIVDTSNTLRWFIFHKDVDISGEFQCPEWSTHPNYIACLSGLLLQPYSGYAIRISDKKTLKLCNKVLTDASTPHIWLPDTAQSRDTAKDQRYDSLTGFVNKEAVEQFFGTRTIKFTYAKNGTIYFIDYSLEKATSPIPLLKPANKQSLLAGSPLISPDGNWVTYHCYANAADGASYSSYLQRLQAGIAPVLIKEGASDPHWWVDPNTHMYNIVYTMTNGHYYSEYDFLDTVVSKNKLAGSTIKQQLSGAGQSIFQNNSTLDIDKSVAPFTLMNLPFKGGMSKDGLFICTAYKYAYIFKTN